MESRMEQKLLVKVRNRQKIYIHNDLENATLYFKTKVEKRVAMVFRSEDNSERED